MSEQYFDEFEHYNYDQEKYLNAGHSGKQRTKLEASQHTNKNDPSGHVRKLVTKMQNTETNKKQQHASTNAATANPNPTNERARKDSSN